MIAHALAKELNVPAYIYDGITVDELTDINRITGLPEMHRKGIGHNLNTRAAAMRYAREQGKAYKGYHRHRGPSGRRHRLLRFYRRGDPPPRVLHCSRHHLSRRG